MQALSLEPLHLLRCTATKWGTARGGFASPLLTLNALQGVLEKVDAAVAAGKPARVAVRSRTSGALLTLVLRPASTDQLNPDKPVGVPNWVRSEKELQAGTVAAPLALDTTGEVGTIDPQLASCFYLAVVEPFDGVSEAGALPAGSPMSSAGHVGSDGVMEPGTPELFARPPRSMLAYGDHSIPPALAGLEMGPLIGSGSFAKGECGSLQAWLGFRAHPAWQARWFCCFRAGLVRLNAPSVLHMQYIAAASSSWLLGFQHSEPVWIRPTVACCSPVQGEGVAYPPGKFH
jgi:hypothetical protein